MLIPDFLYGKYKDVKSESMKVIKKLNKGVPWDEALVTSMIDTKLMDGLIILNGPSPLLGGKEHINIYCLTGLIALSTTFSKEEKRGIFIKCLDNEWSILAVMSRGGNESWVYNILDDYKLFLSVILKCWDLFNEEGQRYTFGVNYGKFLWEIPSNLHYILAKLGIPNEALREPLPPGGLYELLDRFKLLH